MSGKLLFFLFIQNPIVYWILANSISPSLNNDTALALTNSKQGTPVLILPNNSTNPVSWILIPAVTPVPTSCPGWNVIYLSPQKKFTSKYKLVIIFSWFAGRVRWSRIVFKKKKLSGFGEISSILAGSTRYQKDRPVLRQSGTMERCDTAMWRKESSNSLTMLLPVHLHYLLFRVYH